jgi:DNA-binding NarL/FixJ family response regulator
MVHGLTMNATLTRRQSEIAVLIAEGLSNAESAERLMVTEGTVHNHVANLIRRLKLRNRVQVAVWVVRHGLLSTGNACS